MKRMINETSFVNLEVNDTIIELGDIRNKIIKVHFNESGTFKIKSPSINGVILATSSEVTSIESVQGYEYEPQERCVDIAISTAGMGVDFYCDNNGILSVVFCDL